MTESFPSSKGKQVMLALFKTIQDNAHYLSEVDGAIGDGDHGINMNKGFTRTKELLANQDFDLCGGLNTLGEVLLNDIGGAMGPLYGSFFIEMAMACDGKTEIDAQLFAQMLKAGKESIQSLGNAKVGDKTLIDTLLPAEEAFAGAVAEGQPFATALKRMGEAAEQGKESTRNLVARIGRASRLGERSRGVLDAGATSCCLILKAFVNSINELIS